MDVFTRRIDRCPSPDRPAVERSKRFGYQAGMDQLLRLTIALSRLSRRRWTKGQALFALAVFGAALAIGLIEWLGYWPEALRGERAHRLPYRP